jgi:ABC-type multidrug transport system fused ATPase/permease subunit
MDSETLLKYESEGYVTENVGAIVFMIVGVGIAVLVLIFVGVLSGQVYQQVETEIDAINNTTISGHIKESIISGFEALETTGNYLPIVVLAVIIFVVLSIVMGLGSFGTGFSGNRYGGAL